MPIYLDSHSTTPVDPRVIDAMLPYFHDRFGNASSTTHSFGHEAADAVEESRNQIASLIGADSREIIFTSGATESNNLAIKGLAEASSKKGNHIISCAIEHPAVLDPCRKLEKQGYEVTYLPVSEGGKLDIVQLESAIRSETILVTIMHANNEIGVINDVEAIGKICSDREIIFHTDATQSAGKIPVDVVTMNIHMLSMSAHKFYGPKGVGLLYVKKRDPRVRLSSIIDGGGHQRGFRSGTLNVPGIVGMAKALEIAVQDMAEESQRKARLRNRLRTRLFQDLDQIEENAPHEPKLPQNLNIAFHFVDSAGLLNEIPSIAVSTGSACSSAKPEPSHVLLSMGKGEDHVKSSIRFGLTRWTTEDEIDEAAEQIVKAVRRLREHSPLYGEAKKT